MKPNKPYPPSPDIPNMQLGMMWPQAPLMPGVATAPAGITQAFFAKQMQKGNPQIHDLMNLLTGQDREGAMKMFNLLRDMGSLSADISRTLNNAEGPNRTRPWAK